MLWYTDLHEFKSLVTLKSNLVLGSLTPLGTLRRNSFAYFVFFFNYVLRINFLLFSQGLSLLITISQRLAFDKQSYTI